MTYARQYRTAHEHVRVNVTITIDGDTFTLDAAGYATDQTTTPDMISYLLAGIARRARAITQP